MSRLLSVRALAAFACLLAWSAGVQAQTAPPSRVRLYDQPLFLNGGNVAWINFARDVGPGATNLDEFRRAFEGVHASGGNAMRVWLHTTGETTPAWSPTTVGAVVGPGVGTIADIRAILDLAEESEVGVQLCLWSFDMLRQSSGIANEERARALLTSAALTQTYIDTALTPMVTALRDHPALLAWEIFNEPEGMSIEFVFQGLVQRPVPMTDIQRFVNQTAGAIHRADPTALVTNGSVSIRQLTDVQQGASGRSNFNYYTDARLVAQGGDPLGTLDVYNTHYYTWQGQAASPFHNDASVWGLDKPLVVAEFFLPAEMFGIAAGDMYEALYRRGYAGALAWQYYDALVGRVPERENWPRALANMQAMFAAHRADVEVVRAGPDVATFTADAPQVTAGGSTVLRWSVAGATQVTLNGAPVVATGTQTVSPTETTVYTLAARDAAGLTDQRQLTVRVVPSTPANRYEAEAAALVGVAVLSNLPAASGNRYVKMENGGSVTWTVTVPAAGEYTVRFGYHLPFEFKEQFLDVNGARVDTVRFDPPINQFLSVDQRVRLRAGANTVALVKFYGYMDFDYLDVLTPVAGEADPGASVGIALRSAPNPFASATTLRYTLAEAADVRLDVFDATGRLVAELVNRREEAGEHSAVFDAARLPAGVYVARLSAGSATVSRRILVVR